jgi:uncharacterized membrane protein required for colicin V production
VSDLGLNPIDFAVFALIVVAAIYGYRTGFVATTYSLASWIIAIAAALAFEGPAASIVQSVARLPPAVAATIGFVVTILLAEAVLSVMGYVAIRPIVAPPGSDRF